MTAASAVLIAAVLLTVNCSTLCAQPVPVVESKSVPKSATAVASNAAAVETGEPKSVAAGRVGETWRLLYIGAQAVGYEHRSVERVQRGDTQLIVTTDETAISINRFGRNVVTKTNTRNEETTDGRMLRVDFTMSNPPSANVSTKAVVVDDMLKVETRNGNSLHTESIPWTPAVLTSAAGGRKLAAQPWTVGEVREVNVFDAQFGKVNSVKYVAGKPREIPLRGNERRLLQPVSITQSLMALELTEYLDETGESQRSDAPALKLSSFPCSKEQALASLTGATVDLGTTTLIKVPRIDQPHASREAVYKLTAKRDGILKNIPSGPTQQVNHIDDRTATVTVRSLRNGTSFETEPAAEPGAEYLEPNRQIQSNDKQVQALTRAAVGKETDPRRKAIAIERWVAANMKDKNFGTLLATAAEVARDLSGDCTEHAVLVAAMCRAAGVPARVVVGLVYAPSQQAFGGHMWCEAYLNGVWYPLDGTLGAGGIGAAHIKFADYSFSDSGPPPTGAWVPLVAMINDLQMTVIRVDK